MLYGDGKRLVEAKDCKEAERLLGHSDFKAYRKPSEKAFFLWMWIRLGKKDGAVLKTAWGWKRPDFMEEYEKDPSILYKDLRKAGAKVEDYVWMKDSDYDGERHTEMFYRRNKA